MAPTPMSAPHAGAPCLLVYTTPTCPDCLALKRSLVLQEIAVEERDLTDPQIAAQAKSRTGLRVAAIPTVGEEVFYGTFESQKPRLIEGAWPGGRQLKGWARP